MRLTKKEFRAWLEANRRRVVGRTCTMGDCPLARFIKEKGDASIVVLSHRMFINGKWRKASRWEGRFIGVLDGSRNGRHLIRGASALKILDSI